MRVVPDNQGKISNGLLVLAKADEGDTAMVVGRGVRFPMANRLVVIDQGLLVLPCRGQTNALLGIRLGIIRRQPDTVPEIGGCAEVILQAKARSRAVVPDLALLRVELERAVEVAEGRPVVALNRERRTAEVIGRGVLWVEPQSFGIVGNRLREVLLQAPGYPSLVQNGRGQVRPTPQALGVIADGAVVIARYQEGRRPLQPRLGVSRIEGEGLGVRRHCFLPVAGRLEQLSPGDVEGGVVRTEAQRLVEVGDRPGAVPQSAPGNASVGQGPGQLGVEPNRLVQVFQSLLVLSPMEVNHAAVQPGEGQPGIQNDRRSKVGQSGVAVPEGQSGRPAEVAQLGVKGLQVDGRAVVGDCAGRLTLFRQRDASVFQRLRRIGLQPEGLRQVVDGAIRVAGLQARFAPANPRPALSGIAGNDLI